MPASGFSNEGSNATKLQLVDDPASAANGAAWASNAKDAPWQMTSSDCHCSMRRADPSSCLFLLLGVIPAALIRRRRRPQVRR
jgi:hypothetical protein